MRLKIFNLFLLIIVVVCSCKTDSPSILSSSENSPEETFKRLLAETNREPTSYVPLWEKKQEYDGEIYVPIKAAQPISEISKGKKWVPNDNNIWLRGKFEKGLWQFSILNVYPNNLVKRTESGIIVYEDLQTRKLTYSEYRNGRLLVTASKRATTSGPYCSRQVIAWVCAELGGVMSCTPRYGLVCPPDPIDYPDNPYIPPINGGGPGGPGGPTTGSGRPRFFPDPAFGSVPNRPYIIDATYDDCISAAVKTLIESNVRAASGQFLLEVFKQSNDFNLIFREEYDLDHNVSGIAWVPKYQIVNGKVTQMDVVIDLNGNTMPSASQEFIASVVIHEAIHAYLFTTGAFEPGLIGAHDAMWATYIDVMAQYLKNSYGMDINEATVLAMGGLHDTFQSKLDDRIYKMLEKKGQYPSEQRQDLIDAYKSGKKGHTCK